MAFAQNSTLQSAYLGKHAQDLLMKTSEQIGYVYRDRGLTIPVLVSSTLHFLSTQKNASLADVARALDLAHQHVTQRVEKLITMGLVEKTPDAVDRRRSNLNLTKRGRKEARLLKQCMEDTAAAYEELYTEIECDLARALRQAIEAIERRPLWERLAPATTNEKAA